MTDQDLINAVVGVLLPLLVAVVMQRQWPDTVRTIITYLIYFAAAAVSAWFVNEIDAGPGDLRGIVRAFLVMAFTAFSSFKLIWQPTGVTPAIENKTSPA